MADSTSKEMTPEELKDFIASMPEGTVVSVEIKVVLEDGQTQGKQYRCSECEACKGAVYLCSRTDKDARRCSKCSSK